MTQPILSVSHLRKSFRSHWTFQEIPALKEVTFEVQQREMFGFLGHNGAGKTTSIKCILGLIRPNGGEIRYNGEALTSPTQRQSIGYLPELPYFYEHLTVRETLTFLATLYGDLPGLEGVTERAHRVDQTLERVGLSFKSKDAVRDLSKGLQQRLGLAQAIIHQPKLLLLDEPFSGLDPLGRHEFKKILTELKSEGCSILLSSHVLSDVESLCDRVSIMAKGSMRETFRVSDIPALFGEEISLVVTGQSIEQLQALGETATSKELRSGSAHHTIDLRFREERLAKAALDSALTKGLSIREYKTAAPSLEEIFVTLTKGPNAQ